MTVNLVLEFSPTKQARNSYRFEGGELTIGRGDDAGWQIDDPDKYVSRRHCVISGQDGVYEVVDASSGGLFVDGGSTPLGPGNGTALEHGMRLRLGDFVMRVELLDATPAPAPEATPQTAVAAKKSPVGFEDDGFFSVKSEEVKRPERPETLPDPFEGPKSKKDASFDFGEEEAPPPPLFDDPFTLDPAPSRAAPEPTVKPTPEPEQTPPPTAAPTDAIKAFMRGLRVSPDMADHLNSPEAMEAMGKRFRLLVDGVMLMLRTRAQEKQNVRVAQTVIGAQDVNPLKSLVTTDDAVAALIKARGQGYLDPDRAIEAAFSDLADHQIRTWTALQVSLRRMIDRFDPAEIERAMEDDGLLESLLSGGRSAKLWKLYQDRYAEIAEAAENRFLGEVGSEFRDAYEQKGRR